MVPAAPSLSGPPVGEPISPSPAWNGGAKVVAGALIFAAATYLSLDAARRPAPENTKLAAMLRSPTPPPSLPQVVFVPVPVSASPEARSVEPGGLPEPEPSPNVTESLTRVGPVRSVESPLPIVATPTVVAMSEKERGEAELERALIPLAEKADKADLAWARYEAGCHENVSSTTSRAAAGTRVWFGDGSMVETGAVAGSTAYSSTWTEACSELGTVRFYTQQIRSGMCQAEEAARRAGVYPGTVRALRAKYRLEWNWCSF